MFEAKNEYLKEYINTAVVIKCGGETLENDMALKNVIEQILFLASKGLKVALVHGGGGQIKQRASERGIEEIKKDGVRITCTHTLQVVEEVLTELNTSLVSRIQKQIDVNEEYNALNVSGAAAFDFMLAEHDEALGYVGEPSSVNLELITERLNDAINVIHPLCVDESGQLLNVNADSVAGAIGRTVQAKRVVFCTSMPGVIDKQGQLISKLNPPLIKELIDDGTITDGMVKKIKECEALLGSVDGVAIVGSANQNSILEELLGEGAGTLIST